MRMFSETCMCAHVCVSSIRARGGVVSQEEEGLFNGGLGIIG